MTDPKTAQRYYDALKHIATAYASLEEIRRTSERRWGLEYHEALEMAYENIIEDARQAVRGRRRPAVKP